MSVDANLAATRDLYANAELAGVEVATFNEHTEDYLKKPQERPTLWRWTIGPLRDWVMLAGRNWWSRDELLLPRDGFTLG